MSRRVKTFRELEVYKLAFSEAKRVFELASGFPKRERYALTDQLVRSSRAVCALVAEAWPRRRYPGAFANILNQAMAEASETQAWLDFAVSLGYIPQETYEQLDERWQQIGGMLYTMVVKADSFSGHYTRRDS